MIRPLFTFFILFFFPVISSGQEYSYTHYGTKEGLIGSTVYCVTQDKEGYLWFGTETGLSRFDGTHFKSFTREDGLPDNEILQLFADSKGRVWIAPFKRTVCYYYKGKIYTAENDSMLSRLQINNYVVRFAEDPEGNILLQEVKRLHYITNKGQVRRLDSIGNHPLDTCALVSVSRSGGFYIADRGGIHKFQDERFTLLRETGIDWQVHGYINLTDDIWVWRKKYNESVIEDPVTRQSREIPFSQSHLNYCLIGKDTIVSCTREGVLVYRKDGSAITPWLLKDIPVSNVLKDTEGNIWFCTLGQGIYRLNSEVVFTIKIRSRDAQLSEPVLSINRYKHSLLASTSLSSVCWLDFNNDTHTQKHIRFDFFYTQFRLTQVQEHPDGGLLLGSDYGLVRIYEGLNKFSVPSQLVSKGFYVDEKKNELVIATDRNVMLMDLHTLKVKDTLWRERATAVFRNQDTTYIGTLTGLYYIAPGKPAYFLGNDFPVLKNRIIALQKSSTGIVWIATYGEGVVGIKNNAVIQHLTKTEGLASDNCNAIFANGADVWVGTDKGLNKITLFRNGHNIKHYGTGDGLGADIINAVYAEGTNIYVGTAEGITFFDETKINSHSRCDLRISSLLIGNRPYQLNSEPLRIPVNNNSMRIDYVGISYKSAGDIQYRYMLTGLDSTWNTTRETFLSYPTLPSGKYGLQIQAINKFGVYSEIINLPFVVEEHYTEKTWFKSLVFFAVASFVSLLVFYLTRRIRLREQQKTASARRMNELEQLALKSQMNPHFIFNCLNSIQQYVMDKDVAGSNKFITNFSRLIRKTLDFSSRQYVSLAEEIGYLSSYLELEKMRLEDKFSYSITVDEGIYAADYYIPPMILQPYLENSIRHGIRYRHDKNGIISVVVSVKNDTLICILEDNGIGRKAAGRLKSASPIEYQSKGMSLTADRVAILNKDNEHKISIVVEDMEDDAGQATGTRVILSFPVVKNN